MRTNIGFVPLIQAEIESDELSLVASGQMTLPKKRFRENRFWAIGARSRFSPKLSKAIDTAVEAERRTHSFDPTVFS